MADRDVIEETVPEPAAKRLWTRPQVSEASIHDHTAAAASTIDDGTGGNLLSS